MKLTAQDNIKKKIWEVGIEPIDTFGSINASLGMVKGDMIIYAGDANPQRFSPGNVAGKFLMTDPTAPLGWVLSDPGGIPTTQLKNVSGGQVLAGRVVQLSYGTNTPSFVLAPVNATAPLFITAEDSGNNDTVSCYGVPGLIVPVMISGTITRGNGVKITAKGYGGKASTSPGQIGIALQTKTTTGNGLIKVLLIGTGGKMLTVTDAEESGGGGSQPDNLVISWTGRTLTVKDGYEHRNDAGKIQGLQITLPATPTPLFHCTVSFHSAATTFNGISFKKGTTTYAPKVVGHALTKKNVRYNLAIWWDGSFYWCCCKAA